VRDGLGAVVRAHDDGHPRPCPVRERRARVRSLNRSQRRLRSPLPVGEPEVPVLDVVSAAMPLVGPREHERARAAGCERVRQLPPEAVRLLGEPVPGAVEADFREEKRPVSREVLQPSEVRGELLGRLQIDVEGAQVEERKLEVLGRGVVDVRDEPVRIHVLRGPVQALDEALDAPPPVPADDRGGDLVAYCIAENRRVARAHLDEAADALHDRPGPRVVVKKRDVLLPRQSDEHTETMLGRAVEEPRSGRRVCPNGVDACGRHGGKVPTNLRPVVKFRTR
jgi:hypothetical protein